MGVCWLFIACGWSLIQVISVQGEVYDLKKKMSELNAFTTYIKGQNDVLLKELNDEKSKCENKLRPLINQKISIEERYQIPLATLYNLTDTIAERRVEEDLVLKALEREYNTKSKYGLQIELYTQEVNLIRERKENGIEGKCKLLKSSFQQHAPTISIRSVRTIPTVSSRNRIIYLQNELNQEKLKAKALQNQNEELKAQITYEKKLCEIKLLNTKKAIESSLQQLKESIEDIHSVKNELSELETVLKQHRNELGALKENNLTLQRNSKELHDTLHSYNDAISCYTELALLNIQIK